MQHNTHNFVRTSEGWWECHSHNFIDVVGKGEDKDSAWVDMNRRLNWVWDNDPVRAKQNLQHRLQNNLLCMCGVLLEEPPLAVYRGGNKIVGIS